MKPTEQARWTEKHQRLLELARDQASEPQMTPDDVAQAVAAEREACAMVAETKYLGARWADMRVSSLVTMMTKVFAGSDIAVAIRARGNLPQGETEGNDDE